MTSKTVKCKRCNGTGRVPDNKAVGEQMQAIRKKAGITLSTLSKLLKHSPSISYLSDLERGNRRWSQDLINKYQEALK